jgi:uncharacterized protein
MQIVKLRIGNHVFDTKVLNNEKDIRIGMMRKKFDHGYNALLFYPIDNTGGFWMKNCIIPLDIIFLKGNKIKYIHRNCPTCHFLDDSKCPRYHYEDCDSAIEVEGGTCRSLGIRVGNLCFLDESK